MPDQSEEKHKEEADKSKEALTFTLTDQATIELLSSTGREAQISRKGPKEREEKDQKEQEPAEK